MATDLELLNERDHAALRIQDIPDEAPHFVQIVASEFAAAAATCPIFLTKNAGTGQFYAGAMFGFEPGENLLRSRSGEIEAFRPLDLERQGFFVSGDSIAIDPTHPRFGSVDGDPLFDDGGQPRERLRHIQRVLGQLHAGVDDTDTFIQTLVQHRLVEPIDLELRFDDGKSLSLRGLYTVSLDALGELDDRAVLDLFRKGYLQLAYVMAASLKQIPILARKRNQRLTA